MKDEFNHHRAPLWAGLACLGVLIGIATHRAADPEDRKLDAKCTRFQHQYVCEHKITRNPGMCFTNVALCSGATTSNMCVNTNITYYQVNSDFPQQGDTPDPTTICRQTEGGSAEYTIWAAHHYIASPPAECYCQVRCKWNPTSSKCEPWYCIGPKMSLGKLTAVNCP